jgi:hypothetical protein
MDEDLYKLFGIILLIIFVIYVIYQLINTHMNIVKSINTNTEGFSTKMGGYLGGDDDDGDDDDDSDDDDSGTKATKLIDTAIKRVNKSIKKVDNKLDFDNTEGDLMELLEDKLELAQKRIILGYLTGKKNGMDAFAEIYNIQSAMSVIDPNTSNK